MLAPSLGRWKTRLREGTAVMGWQSRVWTTVSLTSDPSFCSALWCCFWATLPIRDRGCWALWLMGEGLCRTERGIALPSEGALWKRVGGCFCFLVWSCPKMYVLWYRCSDLFSVSLQLGHYTEILKVMFIEVVFEFHFRIIKGHTKYLF